MSASLVGSEMCIRDSFQQYNDQRRAAQVFQQYNDQRTTGVRAALEDSPPCLLYTSDAADDM
eukprot:8819698-Alexandrium_andersonii.AAC.1